MTFQVLVKTLPHMNGSYGFLLSDRANAVAFVQRPDIWWYTFPLEDDDLAWHKGGAWTTTDEDRRDMDLAADLQNAELKKQLAEEDDNDEDRW